VFGLGAATRIYLAPGATDMRKGFNGLYGLVRDQLLCDPLSGHLFLFLNSQRNRSKVLFWGYNRPVGVREKLEKGRLHRPQASGTQSEIVLSHEEFAMRKRSVGDDIASPWSRNQEAHKFTISCWIGVVSSGRQGGQRATTAASQFIFR
jgi:transposase